MGPETDRGLDSGRGLRFGDYVPALGWGCRAPAEGGHVWEGPGAWDQRFSPEVG